MELHYTKGWKYQLEKDFRVKLHNNFEISEAYSCDYYSITPDGWLTAYKGCCWDGPTWFPDFRWMMKPSLIHDCLHWLIAKGVIGEWANDLIDSELAYWIEKQKGNSLLYKIRARYVKRATMKVDQKKGETKKVYIL